jgi:EmrB/QacA subfamily drug resistance transporter
LSVNPPAPSEESQDERLRPSVLTGLMLSIALVPLGSTMIAVAIPDIAKSFSRDPALLTQWLVNTYLVVGIILLSPAGKLGDRWGPRHALFLGQGMFAAGAALGLLTSAIPWLVAARVTMAAGGALMSPATMSILRNTTAPQRRARVFGMFGAVMGLAAAMGPPLGGILVQAFGWRAIFLANLPILALGVVLLRGMPHPPEGGAKVKFDWTGSILLALGLAGMVGGSKAHGVLALALVLGGFVMLVVFIRWERYVEEPVLDPGLFRHAAFTAGSAIIALQNLAMYALLFQLPVWLEELMGAGSAQVGQVLLGLTVAMVLGSPMGGRLSERVGTRAVAVTGTLLALAGLVLLTGVMPMRKPTDAIWPLMLVGIGMGITGAPSQAAALSAIDRTRAGMASGAMSIMRYLGGVLGIGVLGYVLRGTSGADPAVALAAHHRAVWVFCAATVVALVPAAMLPGKDS